MTKLGTPAHEKMPSISQDFDGIFFSKSLITWYKKNARPLPWRVLWKKHENPWHIWVSEIMLQQTVIKAVIKVYSNFLRQFPDFKALAKADAEDVRLAVRGLGYYRRFDALHRACRQLVDEKQSLPATHCEWLKLPGIGDYTASAIASITAGEPHGVVDGNVERVLCRILDIRTAPNLPVLKKFFKKLMDEMCSKSDPGVLNQSVMELGQTICTPLSPSCDECPISKGCLAFKRSSQALAPGAKRQKKPADVNLRLHIIHVKNKILLTKRPDDAKFLANTWGFPTQIKAGQNWAQDGSRDNIKIDAIREVGRIKHAITHHRISALVMQSDAASINKKLHTRYFSVEDVEKNLVSNLDRKAWSLQLKNSKAATGYLDRL
jgi:A/G-specific adenine glycosylase